MRKYAAFNPVDGSYAFTQSIEELKSLLAQRAWAFFLSHTHSAPITIVDVDEATGAEVWRTPDGTLVMSPAEIQALLEAEAQAFLSLNK